MADWSSKASALLVRALVSIALQVYDSLMSTLAEIASAAYRLPLVEQEELLRQLARRLRGQRAAMEPTPRELWMARLEALQDSIGSGKQKQSSERILEELREERN